MSKKQTTKRAGDRRAKHFHKARQERSVHYGKRVPKKQHDLGHDPLHPADHLGDEEAA